MIQAYFAHIFIMMCIYAILSMSLNLALGYAGLLNLGHVAFYAIGAYTSALLAIHFGVPFWIGAVGGMMMAGLFGYALSFPTIRLKGDYLALGTLGFSIIIENVFLNWTSLTRGALGLSGIPRAFASLGTFSIFLVVCVIVVYVLLHRIVASPFGRSIRATRDDEIAASVFGKHTLQIKMIALIFSASLAGFAGSIYAHYITYIDPTGFSIAETILILSMVFVGGPGNLLGSVFGAILLVLLPEPLRFLHIPSTMIGGIRQALYAALLVIIVLVRPQGLIKEKPQEVKA